MRSAAMTLLHQMLFTIVRPTASRTNLHNTGLPHSKAQHASFHGRLHMHLKAHELPPQRICLQKQPAWKVS